MNVNVDSDTATGITRNIKKGLSNKDLKKWYERKGFIFDEDSLQGYRPAKTEDKTLFKPKLKKITEKEIKKIEKHFNKSYFETQDFWFSDPMTLKEFASEGKLKKGYINDGTNDIFYFDGNKLVKISNIFLDYDYNTKKYKVKRK